MLQLFLQDKAEPKPRWGCTSRDRASRCTLRAELTHDGAGEAAPSLTPPDAPAKGMQDTEADVF